MIAKNDRTISVLLPDSVIKAEVVFLFRDRT